jgi:hypothetical protein
MTGRGYIVLIGLVLLSSCFPEKDKPGHLPNESGTLLILNEGNFQWGNASVSSYRMHDGTLLSKDLFESVNGRPLGDVLQSAVGIDDKFWLVLNNSGKIELVNQQSFESVRTISGLNSPRYLCEVNEQEIALTDLYAGEVKFLQKSNGGITGRVSVPEWTEELCLFENCLWVTSPKTACIYRIDIEERVIKDSFSIGYGSFSVYTDASEHIWVATKGNPDTKVSSMIHCLNGRSGQLRFSIDFGEIPIQDFFVDKTGLPYVLHNNRVYRINGQNKELLFEASHMNLYSLEVHNSKILLTNAFDYVRNGQVLVIDLNGKINQQFESGRIPNGFLFIP